MTRVELLRILVGQARENGFEFRRWYTSRLGLPWESSEDALFVLDTQRRYYALLFAHEFASTFWKPGGTITFQMPEQTFESVMPDGSVRTIHRKPFIRRSSRRDAWKYHLRQMALAEEPLRYMRKYLNVEDEITEEAITATGPSFQVPTTDKMKAKPGEVPRPLLLARSAAERRAEKLKTEAVAAQKKAVREKRRADRLTF